MQTDPHGNVLIPKWFLNFLSIFLTILSISAVPWAVSVSRSLNSLSTEVTTLRARFQGRVDLQNEVIRNIYDRMERIERKVDRIDEQQRAKHSGVAEGGEPIAREMPMPARKASLAFCQPVSEMSVLVDSKRTNPVSSHRAATP